MSNKNTKHTPTPLLAELKNLLEDVKALPKIIRRGAVLVGDWEIVDDMEQRIKNAIKHAEGGLEMTREEKMIQALKIILARELEDTSSAKKEIGRLLVEANVGANLDVRALTEILKRLWAQGLHCAFDLAINDLRGVSPDGETGLANVH